MSSWIKPIATAALIAGSCVAMVGAASAEDGVTADTIVFGQAAALDGPAAALGTGMKAGIERRVRGSQQEGRRSRPQIEAHQRR